MHSRILKENAAACSIGVTVLEGYAVRVEHSTVKVDLPPIVVVIPIALDCEALERQRRCNGEGTTRGRDEGLCRGRLDDDGPRGAGAVEGEFRTLGHLVRSSQQVGTRGQGDNAHARASVPRTAEQGVETAGRAMSCIAMD